MFSVSLPVAGDYVLGCIPKSLWASNSTHPLPQRFGLYLSLYGETRKDGARPHTWGRDRFNNSNCVHVNIKGNLFGIPASSNLPYSGGPKTYKTPNMIPAATPTGDQWTSSSGNKYHRLVPFGEDASSDTTYYYYDNTYWWRKHYRARLTYVGFNKYRAEYRYRWTKESSGTISSCGCYVAYVEFDAGKLKTRTRTVILSQTSDDVVAEEWLAPTGSWVTISSSNRTVLSGYTSVPSITAVDIVHRLKKMHKLVAAEDLSSFGKLSVDAAQSLKVFDGQLTLYLRDLIGFKTMITGALKALGTLSLKGLSAAYLSYHYGLRLTYKDTMDLLQSSRRLRDGSKGYNSSRARRSATQVFMTNGNVFTWNIEYNMKLYVRDYPQFVVQALNSLMSVDFFPTLELAWDVIPFSFVVDWFVHIGDVLEAIDSNTLMSTYHVLSCVYSRRAVLRVEIGVLFPELNGIIAGELEIADYNRHISNVPPPFEVDLTTPQSFNHWIEGAALIVQRTRL